MTGRPTTDSTPWSYAFVARNHARASDNRIHDDPVATAYGFKGGLVPGVDVWAYLLHPAAQAWGLDWLRAGRLEASFRSPVYDGAAVTVTGIPVAGGTDGDGADGDAGAVGDVVELTLVDDEGTTCAAGRAVRDGGATAPDPADWPDADPTTRGAPASAESLAVGTAMGPLVAGFHADRAGTYLAEIGETLPVFVDDGIAHPGWLLRFANFVLADHVRLGPWIHTASDVRFLGPVHDGERVETRAVVLDEHERKGHRFVVLDVLVTADGRPVQRTTHTAIHTLRPATSPS